MPERNKLNKKAQVTIWVIVALALVAMISLFFVFKQLPSILTTTEVNPGQYMDKCVKTAVTEAVDRMIPQGGFIEPDNYKRYNNINVTYLCEDIGYFDTCINQHPMYLADLKNEINNYTTPRVSQCFDSLKTELEKRNYAIDYGRMTVDVELGPGKVFVNIARNVKITKNEETRTIDNFNTELVSPLYDLANVAMEISSQEAKYCYFEYVGYMMLYQRFDIRKFAFSDSTKIYTIKDKDSNKIMNIATRSCAIRPGL